ncbi:gpmA, partial [Symbiodinium necroappetens]
MTTQRPHLRRSESLEEIQRAGLFRCTQPSKVLAGFGIIFETRLLGLLEASRCHARYPTIEQVQGAGAHLYNNSKETNHVDVFISHSWSAGRWAKYLALCLFFNFSLAIKSPKPEPSVSP